MELYTRLFPSSVVACIDLKRAFDVANRDVILYQIVDFGIKGRPLKWLRGYLSNSTSWVLYKGDCTTTKGFDLETLQGGVLGPFLFNILMYRLSSCLTSLEPQLLVMPPLSAYTPPRQRTSSDVLTFFLCTPSIVV